MLLFLFIATPAYAMTSMGGQTVTVPKSEVVTGTLFAGGNTVTVDGLVNGDLFCGGQNVSITGTVSGDVICGAQNIRIAGWVGGSVRVAGQNIDVSGTVRRNVTVAGQTLTLEKTATVAGEVIFAGQTLANSGSVSGVVTQFKPSEKQISRPVRIARPAGFGIIGLIVKIIGYSILAVIVFTLAPKWSKRVLEVMRSKLWPSVGSGCLMVIIVPIALVMIAITIIGIPVAILAGLAFGLMVAIARIFAAVWLGQVILDALHTKQPSMVLTAVTGVVAAEIVFAVPVVGGLAGFIAVLWGLGAMFAMRKTK